jgi:hypothetical protein
MAAPVPPRLLPLLFNRASAGRIAAKFRDAPDSRKTVVEHHILETTTSCRRQDNFSIWSGHPKKSIRNLVLFDRSLLLLVAFSLMITVNAPIAPNARRLT